MRRICKLACLLHHYSSTSTQARTGATYRWSLPNSPPLAVSLPNSPPARANMEGFLEKVKKGVGDINIEQLESMAASKIQNVMDKAETAGGAALAAVKQKQQQMSTQAPATPSAPTTPVAAPPAPAEASNSGKKATLESLSREESLCVA